MYKRWIIWFSLFCLWNVASAKSFAATVTWDPALSGGTATGGSGGWASSSADWWSGSTDQLWNNSCSDTAVFAALSGTDSISGSKNIGGLTFASTGDYTLSTGSLNLAALANTISITNSTTDTLTSVLTGSNGLTVQAGTGVLVLAATNTYSGGTVINGGTLSIKADRALGAVPATTSTNLTLNGGDLTFTGSMSLSGTRTVLLGPAGGTLNVSYAANGALTPTTSIFGVRLMGQFTGSGGLTFSGGTGANAPATAPYLFLLDSLSNNYAGNTTINNATVTNDVSLTTGTNLLPVTTVLTLTNSGVFGFYGSGGNDVQTLAGLSGDRTTSIGTENTGTAATLTINPAAGKSYTYAGTIGDVKVLTSGDAGTGGAAVTLNINGQGTEVLTGSNLYSGPTNVNGGTLMLGNGTLAGNGA